MIRRTVLLSIAVSAVTLVWAGQAFAATYTVGTTADTAVGTTCPTPSAGMCSLRQLITYENGLPATPNPPDTIVVPAGSYGLGSNVGAIAISQSLSIVGAGAHTTSVAQTVGTPDRVFDIQIPPGGAVPTVVISGLKISGGTATSSNGGVGGDIRSKGNLTLGEDWITGGTANDGGGAGDSAGTMTVTHSLVSGNASVAPGCAVPCAGEAGGLWTAADSSSGPTPAKLVVDNSTIASNTATFGGGIVSVGNESTVTITSSTIANNDGGNFTGTSGGLLAFQGGAISVQGSIVAFNTVKLSGTTTPSNCGVAGTTPGVLTSLGHNLETGTDCGFTSAGDLQSTDPLFMTGALGNNGGNTGTFALHAQSPAVDAIPAGSSGCNGTDQRDLSRPRGKGCDIGAYELFQPAEGAQFTTVLGGIAPDTTPVTINWGDGMSSGGTFDSNLRQESGTHTYVEQGIYHGVINWHNSDHLPVATPFDLKVTDVPISVAATPVTAIAGVAFSGQVAAITDNNPSATVSGFTAAINWGDGTPNATGTVSQGSSGLVVSGTHTYATAGSYPTQITVTDTGGPTASGIGSATVNPPLPTVTAVSPASGPLGGGTSVTITGTDLTGASAVKFGTKAATSFTVNSATKITATAPAGSAGTVDVAVTTISGTSTSGAGDKFTYVPAPSVTSVAPVSGPLGGGTSVTITGTGFGGANAVKFGATSATTYTVNSATKITATAPAGTGGTVDVRVTTVGGTSGIGAGDKYTYVPAPSVTRVVPVSGPLGGGTSVTITGTGFGGANAVKFGATSATTYTVNSATKITATAPAGTGGTVDVRVTTVGGTSGIGAGDKYTYVPAPSVTRVAPASGPLGGGTTVTITGTGFGGASAVKFGATNATTFTVNSATKIMATAPAGTGGTVDVRVTTVGGTSATGAGDKFTYVPAPTVTSVAPSSGPLGGGTTVTITGTGFTGASAVKFGATNATTYTVNSATRITATAPSGAAGTVDVRVTTVGGTSAISAGDHFTYIVAPIVTGLTPNSGSIAGGTSVAITGSGFGGASAVRFGTSAAIAFTVDSATQITATAPAGPAGTIDVTVTTVGGTSATNATDQFTYVAAKPDAATVSPTVEGSTAAAFVGSVNPEGLLTTAHFEYGLDPAYQLNPGGQLYTASTPAQTVGSDTNSHTVSAGVTGLLPNAIYHVRLVASNSAGATAGPDKVFHTSADPAPPPPTLGKTFDVTPVSGLVFIKLPGNQHPALDGITKGAGFIPLTESRQLPPGTQVDARQGALKLIAAAASSQHIGKTQSAIFSSGLFKIGSQIKTGIQKGLTVLSLQEDIFPGSPSYRSCPNRATSDHATSDRATGDPLAHLAVSRRILQTLHASGHGRFRTRGRYSAGTVRGTIWDTVDRCDGTLTIVRRGTVDVLDNRLHKTFHIHAHHSYLARAIAKRKASKP